MEENAKKVMFVAVRWVDVTYFHAAYAPDFYRPITGMPEQPAPITEEEKHEEGHPATP